MATMNPTVKPVKKTSVKKTTVKKTPTKKMGNTALIPGMGFSNLGSETMSGKKGLSIKKAQNGAKTADSTAYFSKKADSLARSMKKKNLKGDFKGGSKDLKGALGALKDEYRQGNKGQSGYDKNGYPLKKKMKNGGSLSALNASTKRDKGVDPKGAFTKVQKKTLAGAKGKASLTKDKQLGATKMKMGGKMKKC